MKFCLDPQQCLQSNKLSKLDEKLQGVAESDVEAFIQALRDVHQNRAAQIMEDHFYNRVDYAFLDSGL